MMNRRQRKIWVALLLVATVAMFAACKGETPTTPPLGGGGGGTGTGGGTPTSNIVLTVSNTSPVIDSTVTVTATVTINGAPAPDGTAVEFTTNAGNFTDVNPPVQSLLRTTTNGQTSVHLTHSSPSTVRVTAVMGSILRTIDITFRNAAPCVPPAPGCPDQPTATVTGLSPTFGRPQGGQLIRITGTNLKAPVKVLFDVGGPVPVEASVVNVTSTFIDVLTPAVNIGVNQQLNAPVIVINEAGTTNEERLTVPGGFTFRNEVLTPVVFSLTPTSGPINGGTRITIVGEAFQAPVQVFFGSAEAQVVEVDYGRIVVIAPEGRATNPDGSGTVVGPVPVQVVNINSNTRTTSPQAFRYVAKMQITAVTPFVGSALGGTVITIDGVGFDAPVDVVFELLPERVIRIQAQVLEVSGTRLRVRTSPLPIPCGGGLAIIVVTNVENGDIAEASNAFQYVGVDPQILSVVDADTSVPPDTPDISPGETVRVRVDDPGIGPLGSANIRFQVAGSTLIPAPSQITDGVTPTDFTFAMPLTGFTFPTIACTIGGAAGTQLGPVQAPVTFLNVTTGCLDTTTITVVPAGPNTCVVPPQAVVSPAGTPGNCADVGSVAAAGNATTGTTIRITNAAPIGAQNLFISSATVTGTNGTFTITPPAAGPIAPGSFQDFNVQVDPTAAGPTPGNATFTTNDPNRGTITVCITGNGT